MEHSKRGLAGALESFGSHSARANVPPPLLPVFELYWVLAAACVRWGRHGEDR